MRTVTSCLALTALLGTSLLSTCLISMTGRAYEQTSVAQVKPLPASKADDEQVIRKLIKEWVEVRFSPKGQTEEFKFQERLAKFYDSTPGGVILHDNADPQMRIATSVEDYGKIWDEIFLPEASVLKQQAD